MAPCCSRRGPDPAPTSTRSSITILRPASARLLTTTGDTPRFVPTGHLVYARLDALFAAPWRDLTKGLDDAAPIPLPELPRIENEGSADYVLSTNGTLA